MTPDQIINEAVVAIHAAIDHKISMEEAFCVLEDCKQKLGVKK